jgi:hypothetical protein
VKRALDKQSAITLRILSRIDDCAVCTSNGRKRQRRANDVHTHHRSPKCQFSDVQFCSFCTGTALFMSPPSNVVPSIEEHVFLRQADMTMSVVAPEFDGALGRSKVLRFDLQVQ